MFAPLETKGNCIMANLLDVPIDYSIEQTALGVWRRYRDEKTGYFQEFTSHGRLGSWPLFQYVSGKSPVTGSTATARGIVAVGKKAMGVLAVGQLAVGVVAIGQAAIGVFALGQLALGLLVGVGQGATGVVAVGQLAIGVFCAGQLAVGYRVMAQLDVVAHVRRLINI